jgi:murein DD-endopeptidase MepM/ murein hydrolase activator NlpD
MQLDYSPAGRSPRPVRRIVVVASLSLVGLAVLISRESAANRQLLTDPSGLLPEVSAAAAVAYEQAIQSAVSDTLAVPAASDWVTHEVKTGETLSTIIESEGMTKDQWIELLALGESTKPLRNLDVGDKLLLRKNGDRLEELSYEINELRTLQVRRTGESEELEANILTAELEHRTAVAQGAVSSSLFNAGQSAGLTVQMTMELAEIFRYDIDFALDIREGDHFTVVYEELYKDGKKLRDGDVLAAEFVNQGKAHRAVRYVGDDKRSAYYSSEGQSLRKAFFRTPLDVVRISSPFNLRRRHPILNTIRAHKGVDYAAASGTPIKATGDGRVEFIGVKGGYGRVIVIQHGSQYETLYAHMSRYRPGLTVGSRVSQGQVIGYVGASGLATAPHLHYEFRVNGIHKNPVNITLPRANPISRTQLAKFRIETAPLLSMLDQGDVLVAQAAASMRAETPPYQPGPVRSVAN